MAEPNPVRVPVQIRWRDLDPLRHINNAAYITYFELARLHYIHALLGDEARIDPNTLLPAEFQFILAEVICRYRAPATLGDELVVALWVSQVGRKSFVFEYRIVDERTGRRVAEGRSTQVWFDYAAGESRPVPEEMIRRIQEFQGAAVERD